MQPSSHLEYITDQVEKFINHVKSKGYALRKTAIESFKSHLPNRSIDTRLSQVELVRSFENKLSSYLSRSSDIGCVNHDSSNSTIGTMYFDQNQVSEQIANDLYGLLYQKAALAKETSRTLTSDCVKLSDISKMIEEQTKIFCNAESSFDYRTLFDSDSTDTVYSSYFLGKYLHKPLSEFLEKILNLKSKKNGSEYHKACLQIQMVIGILCHIKNNNCVFVQTMIGLALFGGHVKDKICDLLAMFGLTTSSRTIRRLVNHWSSKRDILQEVDTGSFWLFSFDNLNFLRKYAHTFKVGGKVVGRMLNLLTGQLVHGYSKVRQCIDWTDQSLFGLSPDDFFVRPHSAEEEKWNSYMGAVLNVANKRHGKQVKDYSTSFVEELQNYLPSFSPDVPDNCTFVNVEVASSTSKDDIHNYLLNTKLALHIGEPGYPTKIIVTGDQQTFSLVKKLKHSHPDLFDWIQPYPGDWHLMKLAAETLRNVIKDGGLGDLARECGYKKDLHQWKDIHRLILALYESLLHESLAEWKEMKNLENVSYDDFIKMKQHDDNLDEVSRFWANMLQYFHAYVAFYFSIRSGDWNLRNAALPQLAELFFAFSHDKYEELVCGHLLDIMSMPSDVKKQFEKGEWTTSVKGRPYHNLALDEAHECLINRKLKELARNPNECNTVTIANFIAYLDKYLDKLQAFVYRYSKRADTASQSARHNEYLAVMQPIVQPLKLFSSTRRTLRNLFNCNAPLLDAEQRRDLLKISSDGKNRMLTYIKQYVIKPPLERPMKRRRNKLKTFSKNKSSLQGKISQASRLSKMNKGLVSLVKQTGHFYDQVMELPLALCNEHGRFRSRTKSAFTVVLRSIFPSFMSTMLPFDFSQKDTEVVIDFLKFVHKPPAITIATYQEFSRFLWDNVVCAYGFDRGAKIVTLVFDKAQYLPRIRDIIHEERSQKHAMPFTCPSQINHGDEVPHGQLFAAALSNEKYKSLLINYLSNALCDTAKCCLKSNESLIIDSPTFDQCPHKVVFGKFSALPERSNNKGEADIAIWWHVKFSHCKQILVHATDTDIYLYGVALMDLHFFHPDKQIAVETQFNNCFVSINGLNSLIKSEPSLHKLSNWPSVAILAIYLLSGSDYVSGFYGLTANSILSSAMQHTAIILFDGKPFVGIEQSNGLCDFEGLSVEGFTRLFTCAYLEKNVSFYNHLYPTLMQLWDAMKLNNTSLTNSSMNPSLKALYDMVDIDHKSHNDACTLAKWTDFTRRVCYFNHKGNATLFQSILPTNTALELQIKRGEYILKLLFESAPVGNHYSVIATGWIVENHNIKIKWDEKIKTVSSSVKKKANKCACSKCAVDGPGCLRCAKACLPCNKSCKCKGQCLNPHNNGGTCSKCQPEMALESDAEETSSIDTDSEDLEEEFDFEEGPDIDFGIDSDISENEYV